MQTPKASRLDMENSIWILSLARSIRRARAPEPSRCIDALYSVVVDGTTLQLDAPDTPPTADAEPFAVVVAGVIRDPSQVSNFVVALPACNRALDLGGLGCAVHGRSELAREVPQKYLAVVATRGKCSSPVRRPLNAAQRPAVASELGEGMSRLPHIQDSDDIRILSKGGQDVGIMRRCRDAKEWWRVRHRLLR